MSVTDPVCGLEFDESLAIVHEYDEKNIISVAMGAERSLSKNQKNGKSGLSKWKLSTHSTKF